MENQRSAKFKNKARGIIKQNLGSNSIMTMALEKYKITEILKSTRRNNRYSSTMTKSPFESPPRSLRFLTGDRLQPMHQIKSSWRSKLSSLSDKNSRDSNNSYLLSNTLTSNFPESNTEHRILPRPSNLKPLIKENQNLSNKAYIKKQIRIVPSKIMHLEKIRNQAAVTIQKHIRKYLCRKTYLGSKNPANVDINCELLNYFGKKNAIDDSGFIINDIFVEKDNKKALRKEDMGMNTEIFLEDYANDKEENQENDDILGDLQGKRGDLYGHGGLTRDNGAVNSQQYNKTKIDIIEEELEISSEGNSIIEPFDSPHKNLNNFAQKSKQNKCAKVIQRAYRQHLYRKCCGFEPKIALKSAVKIQRYYKNYKKNKTDKENHAAIMIQKSYRMHAVKILYKDMRNAVFMIQRWYRKSKDKSQYNKV